MNDVVQRSYSVGTECIVVLKVIIPFQRNTCLCSTRTFGVHGVHDCVKRKHSVNTEFRRAQPCVRPLGRAQLQSKTERGHRRAAAKISRL